MKKDVHCTVETYDQEKAKWIIRSADDEIFFLDISRWAGDEEIEQGRSISCVVEDENVILAAYWIRHCPKCSGTGKVREDPCSTCGGGGLVPSGSSPEGAYEDCPDCGRLTTCDECWGVGYISG